VLRLAVLRLAVLRLAVRVLRLVARSLVAPRLALRRLAGLYPLAKRLLAPYWVELGLTALLAFRWG
jgi:hypothetical protein